MRETHEYLIVLRNMEFTVLMAVRESIESLIVRDANGSDPSNDTVIETGRRRECLGIEVGGDSLRQCRPARQAIGTEELNELAADLSSTTQPSLIEYSHPNLERQMV